MTVKDLIRELEKLDEKREVRVYLKHKEHDLPIEEITTLPGKDTVWIDVDRQR
jgi:hypothetical protein